MNIFDTNFYNTFENLLDLSTFNKDEPIDLLELLKIAKQNPEVTYYSICKTINPSTRGLNENLEQAIRGTPPIPLSYTTNFVLKFPVILKAIPSLKTKYI